MMLKINTLEKILIIAIVVLTVCLVAVKRKEINSRPTVKYWGNGTRVYTEKAVYFVKDGYLEELKEVE